MSSSWYLSVDTQLYILSPLPLFFLFRQQRVAWLMLALFLLLALVSASVLSFLYNLPAALIPLGLVFHIKYLDGIYNSETNNKIKITYKFRRGLTRSQCKYSGKLEAQKSFY